MRRVGLILGVLAGVACGDDTAGPGLSVDAGPHDASLDAAPMHDATVVGDAGRTELECEQLPELLCHDDCLAITGQSFERTAMCANPAGFVGCVSAHRDCAAPLAISVDPQNRLWQYSSGCLPTFWVTPYFAIDAGIDRSDWPACGSADAGVGDASR